MKSAVSVLTGVLLTTVLGAMPLWAQVYGPDGKELPPVSNNPPSAPAPHSANSTGWFSPARPRRFGVTLGALFPVGALSDRTAGHVWPLLSLSYDISLPTAGRPYTLSAFLDATATSRSFKNEFGDPMNEIRELYGLGLQARHYMPSTGPVSVYAGVGGGAFFIRRGTRFDSSDSPFVGFDDQSLVEGKYYVQPGYKVILGFEEKHGFVLEARYLDAGTLEGVRYNGITTSIGGRF